MFAPAVAILCAQVGARFENDMLTEGRWGWWPVSLITLALVLSAGGFVQTLEGTALVCNRKNPLLSGLIACGPNLQTDLVALLGAHLNPVER